LMLGRALKITRSGDYTSPIAGLRSRSMAAQWEYKVEELGAETGAFAQYLNDEGGGGWELVTVVELGVDDVGLPHAVFRRELANPTWER
jgi:hypothetical protein